MIASHVLTSVRQILRIEGYLNNQGFKLVCHILSIAQYEENGNYVL
jgi:hypothetical protein